MKIFKGVIGTVVIIGILFLVISNINTREISTEGPIVIGFIGPIEGDASVYGIPYKQSTELAVKQINEGGGINGRELQVIYENGGCNREDATRSAEKLINIDKVNVIVGLFCSDEALAVVPIASKAKVMVISGGASAPALTDIDRYFVRTYPSDAKQGKSLAEVAYKDKKYKNIAIVYEDTAYAEGLYKAFKDSFIDLGGKVFSKKFNKERSHIKNLVQEIKLSNPDAFFISTQTPIAAKLILEEMLRIDWSVDLFLSDTISGDINFIDEYKDILEGSISGEFGINEGSDQFNKFIEDYNTAFDTTLSYVIYDIVQYDTMFLLADALREVNDDPKKLSWWFRRVNGWQGVSGPITIRQNGDTVRGHIPKVIINGVLESYIAD